MAGIHPSIPLLVIQTDNRWGDENYHLGVLPWMTHPLFGFRAGHALCGRSLNNTGGDSYLNMVVEVTTPPEGLKLCKHCFKVYQQHIEPYLNDDLAEEENDETDTAVMCGSDFAAGGL